MHRNTALHTIPSTQMCTGQAVLPLRLDAGSAVSAGPLNFREINLTLYRPEEER
jgi:hypothetical protein